MKVEKTIAIEPVAKSDTSALYDLLGTAGLPLDGLDAHLSMALVAKADGQVVGSAALEVYGEAALLRSVAVTEPLRGTGLGHRLVEATLERARRYQIQRIYLLTETAAQWFPRFGFMPVERVAVDPAVQLSAEFVSACPDSAQAMALELTQ